MREIRRYIAEENPTQAKIFVEDLINKLFDLAEKGVTGSPRDHIRPELRVFPYRGRCFYFFIREDEMLVVRVLHERQDLSDKFA